MHTIYIKQDDQSFRPATNHDLEVRGYVSTQTLPDQPTSPIEDIEITVTSYTHQQKVRLIKVIRDVLYDHYQAKFPHNGSRTFHITPPKQRIEENSFGLKHIKRLVEGEKEYSIIIPPEVFQKVVYAIEQKNLQDDIEFSLDIDKVSMSNNLADLQSHREKLMEQLHLIDDLIAQQLYS